MPKDDVLVSKLLDMRRRFRAAINEDRIAMGLTPLPERKEEVKNNTIGGNS